MSKFCSHKPSPDRSGIRGDILLLLLTLTVAYVVLFGIQPNQQSRLVGYGCIGASGPMYADEEDDFPSCEEIKPNQ